MKKAYQALRWTSQCLTVKLPVASSLMGILSPQDSQMMRPLAYSSVGDVLWAVPSVSDFELARSGSLGRAGELGCGSFRFCGTLADLIERDAIAACEN